MTRVDLRDYRRAYGDDAVDICINRDYIERCGLNLDPWVVSDKGLEFLTKEK